jgi:hypothetical protein
MEQASTIGLDIAKHVFQAHGADAAGHVPQAPHTNETTRVLRGANTLRCRDGSVRRFTLLGSRDPQVGAYGAPDPARLRQAVRETTEERRGGCRGNL